MKRVARAVSAARSHAHPPLRRVCPERVMSEARKDAHPAPDDVFTTETAGLAEVGRPAVVRLHDGDSFSLRISAVRNRVGGDVLRMLAYNGSIPGPTLYVDQGSEITVEIT